VDEIRQQWQQLAQQLGFEFKPSFQAIVESKYVQVIAEEQGKDISEAAAVLNNPLVRGLLEKLFVGIATGTYRQHEFTLLRKSKGSSSSSNRPSYYVSAALFFARPYRLGMRVYPEGLGSKVGKFLLRLQDVQVGNPEFDPKVMIKAKDVPGVQSILANPGLQEKLLALLDFSRDFQVTDYGITYTEPGHIVSVERAHEIMDRMADAADQFKTATV